jgi:hypothetical protein
MNSVHNHGLVMQQRLGLGLQQRSLPCGKLPGPLILLRLFLNAAIVNPKVI